MAVTDLPGALLSTLTTGKNQPGLATNLFSYPGAGNGVVLGDNTAPNILGPAPAPVQDPAVAAKAAQDARNAAAIEAGYGQIIGLYDRQLGDIPNQISDAGAMVNSQYGAQKGSIDTGYQRGNANLQFARDDLGTKTNRSIQDLARSMRQSFDSYSTLIGAKGAGDSSATGQLSYALQKTQAQNRSDIYQNQGDQLGQIAMKQGDLDAQYNDQVKQLDAWKSQQIISIGQQFRQAQQQIEAAKAGANKDKLMALASANSNLVNEAIAALSGVEAQHNNTMAQIKDSLTKIQAPGNSNALAATNQTVTAPNVPANPATFTDNATANNGDSFLAVPYYKRLQQAA